MIRRNGDGSDKSTVIPTSYNTCQEELKKNTNEFITFGVGAVI
jgi:hypothetical protein